MTWRWERNLERWGYWNALLSSSLKRNYVIYSLAKGFWMKSQERQSRAGSVGYVEDSELWKPLSVNSASPFPLCYPWPSAHDWNLLEHIYLFERVIQTQEREREEEVFHPLVLSIDGHQGQFQPRLWWGWQKSKHFGQLVLFFLFFPDCFQLTGSVVEQPGHRLVPVWDAGVADLTLPTLVQNF